MLAIWQGKPRKRSNAENLPIKTKQAVDDGLP